MRTSTAILLILLFCSSARADSQTFNDGVSAYNKGDYTACVTLLTSAVKGQDAKNAAAHYYLAGALLKLNNTKAALEEYRECLKVAPQGASAQFCQQAINHLSVQKPAPPAKVETKK